MIGVFFAAFWTIGEDIAEIVALSDSERKRGFRRCPARFLYLLELLTAIFCFLLPFVSLFAVSEAHYYRCRNVPYRDMEKENCRVETRYSKADIGQMVAQMAIYIAASVFPPFLLPT